MNIVNVLKNKRFRNFNVYFILSLIQKSSSLFLLPIYTRFMSTEQYGVYALCQTLTSITAVILFLAINDNMYFPVMKKNSDVSILISTMVLFEIVSAFLFVIVLVFIRQFMGDISIFHVSFFPFIYYSIFLSITMVFSSTYFYFLQASEKTIQFSILTFSTFSISASLTLYFLILHHLGAMSFIYAAIWANSIVGIFGVIKLLYHFGFQFSVSQLKKMLLFSIPGIPTHLSYWIKECMDRIFLAGSGSLQNTGIYQIALSYSNVLNFGIEAFYNANSPRFVALIQNNEDNENKITSMLPVSMAFFSILAFGISLFASEIISLLTSKSFHGSANYVPFIATALAVSLIYNNVVGILYHYSKTLLVSVTSMAYSLLSIPISFFLVKSFGILGAALSMICSNLIYSLMVYFIAQRTEKFNWPLKKALFLSLLPLIALAVIQFISGLSIIEKLLIKSVCGFIYFAMCYFIVKKELKIFQFRI